MHRLHRHFFATFMCVAIFSLTGTVNGLVNVIMQNPPERVGAALAISWFMNFVFFTLVSMIVLTPVTSIADYLFTRKWSLPFLAQIPALVPLLVAYLFFWSLLFGERFYIVLYVATIGLFFPLAIYWSVFRVTDREFIT